MSSSAIISPCGLYRYRLTRSWDNAGHMPDSPRRVCWIMLNPSTADAEQDDPTIRRCIRFSKAWGYDGMIVVNCFALRGTNPEDIQDSREAGVDPVGPENDAAITQAVNECTLTICAWGTHAKYRGQKVVGMISRPQCLGLNRDGSPKHPLYLPASTKPREFR